VIAHLADNKVKFDNRTQLRIGACLPFDPKTETFVNNSQADGFLTRDYRSPFVVPTADTCSAAGVRHRRVRQGRRRRTGAPMQLVTQGASVRT